MVYIDTNIILRFILNDNKSLSPKAKDIVLHSDCTATYEVVAEVVYVLSSVYEIERSGIEKALLTFLPNITVESEACLKHAIKTFSETKLDFVDCLLASYHLVDKREILTFDKKLNNFIKRSEEAAQSDIKGKKNVL